jgi:hypothetical protein
MRAIAILPSLIATPVAAAGLVCLPADDAGWIALLAEERRAAATFDQTCEEHNEAYDRLFAAESAAKADWNDQWLEAGHLWKFVDARPAHEQGDERATAGVSDYNANLARLRQERDKIEARVRRETGFDAVDQRHDAACAAHSKAVKAIIAHPSRDPDIIAHKLRLLIERYGDDEGDLAPLLASIVGEA